MQLGKPNTYAVEEEFEYLGRFPAFYEYLVGTLSVMTLKSVVSVTPELIKKGTKCGEKPTSECPLQVHFLYYYIYLSLRPPAQVGTCSPKSSCWATVCTNLETAYPLVWKGFREFWLSFVDHLPSFQGCSLIKVSEAAEVTNNQPRPCPGDIAIP